MVRSPRIEYAGSIHQENGRYLYHKTLPDPFLAGSIHQENGRYLYHKTLPDPFLDPFLEAIEDPNRAFWIGVQFHPERMWKRFSIFSGLFNRLVKQAKAQGFLF